MRGVMAPCSGLRVLSVLSALLLAATSAADASRSPNPSDATVAAGSSGGKLFPAFVEAFLPGLSGIAGGELPAREAASPPAAAEAAAAPATAAPATAAPTAPLQRLGGLFFGGSGREPLLKVSPPTVQFAGAGAAAADDSCDARAAAVAERLCVSERGTCEDRRRRRLQAPPAADIRTGLRRAPRTLAVVEAMRGNLPAAFEGDGAAFPVWGGEGDELYGVGAATRAGDSRTAGFSEKAFSEGALSEMGDEETAELPESPRPGAAPLAALNGALSAPATAGGDRRSGAHGGGRRGGGRTAPAVSAGRGAEEASAVDGGGVPPREGRGGAAADAASRRRKSAAAPEAAAAAYIGSSFSQGENSEPGSGEWWDEGSGDGRGGREGADWGDQNGGSTQRFFPGAAAEGGGPAAGRLRRRSHSRPVEDAETEAAQRLDGARNDRKTTPAPAEGGDETNQTQRPPKGDKSDRADKTVRNERGAEKSEKREKGERERDEIKSERQEDNSNVSHSRSREGYSARDKVTNALAEEKRAAQPARRKGAPTHPSASAPAAHNLPTAAAAAAILEELPHFVAPFDAATEDAVTSWSLAQSLRLGTADSGGETLGTAKDRGGVPVWRVGGVGAPAAIAGAPDATGGGSEGAAAHPRGGSRAPDVQRRAVAEIRRAEQRERRENILQTAGSIFEEAESFFLSPFTTVQKGACRARCVSAARAKLAACAVAADAENSSTCFSDSWFAAATAELSNLCETFT